MMFGKSPPAATLVQRISDIERVVFAPPSFTNRINARVVKFIKTGRGEVEVEDSGSVSLKEAVEAILAVLNADIVVREETRRISVESKKES